MTRTQYPFFQFPIIRFPIIRAAIISFRCSRLCGPVTVSLGAVLCASAAFPCLAQTPPTGSQQTGTAPTTTPTKQNPSLPPAPSSKPPGSAGGQTSAPKPAPLSAAPTMQIKRALTGNFLYRFVTAADDSATPIALPAAAGTDSLVALPLPAGLKPQDTQSLKNTTLEILDSDHGKVAHLPVSTGSVTELTESSFQFVQTVIVPVQAHSRGVYNAVVKLTDASNKYSKSHLLTPTDAGNAVFTNVPLGMPITATVSSSGNTPVSQTLTIPQNPPADGFKWPAIEVTWIDVKMTASPIAPAAPATGAAATPSTAVTAGSAPTAPPIDSRSQSPFSGILDTLVSLLVLGGLGYGIYWAGKMGHLKTLLDRLGIQTQPAVATGPQPSPFDKPQKSPLQPITEGTADPLLSGGIGGAQGSVGFGTTVVSTGPRLVATVGAYAGSIFPIAGSADIGRDTANPVALPNDTNASRRHATIQGGNGDYQIVDHGSSNGTFVNGVRVPAQTPQPLRSGDEVQIGTTRFRFEA